MEHQAEAAAAVTEEGSEAVSPGSFLAQRNGSGVRTVFVFLDLPRHVEFRAGDMPILEVGTAVEFDVALRNLRDPRRTRRVEGRYEVKRRVLKYSTGRLGTSGLTQFLEWAPCPG